MSLSKISKTFWLILMLALGMYILMFPKTAITSCYASINNCLVSIIPSLFAFMVITTFLLRSGLYYYLFLSLKPIGKYIFHMSYDVFSIFLLSQIGGFPVGAKLLNEAVQNGSITKKYANQLLGCCFCSGPSFVIGVISIKLYGNIFIGALIYISIFLSNCVIAIIVGIKNKNCLQNNKPIISVNEKILIESVNSSSVALFKVCSMIVFFSVIISAVNIIFKNEILFGLLEVSTIGESRLPAYLISALLSFGGICVIFQIVSLFNEMESVIKFIFIRITAAAISGSISYLLLFVFKSKLSSYVFSNFSTPILSNNSNPIPSFMLVIMTLILLKSTYSNNAQ